jgi:hypothetical protein
MEIYIGKRRFVSILFATISNNKPFRCHLLRSILRIINLFYQAPKIFL